MKTLKAEKEEEEKKRKLESIAAAKEREKADLEASQRQKMREAQRQKRRQADALLTESTTILLVLPSRIVGADQALDQAAFEFREGAFSPFWDAIEKAIQNLASFEQETRSLIEIKEKLEQMDPSIRSHHPQTPVELNDIPDPRITSDRLMELVRQAHKNYQFASIYEQKQTNKILIAGFGTLASAIEMMGDRIRRSIDDLSSTVSISFAIQTQAIYEQTEAIENVLGSIDSTLEDANVSRQEYEARKQEHEARTEEMLDNIQSRRRPRLIPEPGDGNADR